MAITVGALLTAICTMDPAMEVIIADSPFVDGDTFTVDLVTTDAGRCVLSPDVVLALREPAAEGGR